jgi:hypothetical protein
VCRATYQARAAETGELVASLETQIQTTLSNLASPQPSRSRARSSWSRRRGFEMLLCSVCRGRQNQYDNLNVLYDTTAQAHRPGISRFLSSPMEEMAASWDGLKP